MKEYCIAVYCPLSDYCAIYKSQTSTDTNTYNNYSNNLITGQYGWTCKYFKPKHK